MLPATYRGFEPCQNTLQNGQYFGYIDGWFVNYAHGADGIEFSLDADPDCEEGFGEEAASGIVQEWIDRERAEDYSHGLSLIVGSLV